MGKQNLCPVPPEQDYLECEKTWVFALLMGVGGFLGAFTYVLRGGVFCNAQTGNLVLLALALGEGNWSRVLYLILPITAYFLGALVPEAIAGPIKKLHLIRWDTLFIIIEIIAIVILGLIPETAPFQITQITINFICSMQYNTFRQAQGIPMATTFCTNHLRQLAISKDYNTQMEQWIDEAEVVWAEGFENFSVLDLFPDRIGSGTMVNEG